jgi:hypothetical protein
MWPRTIALGLGLPMTYALGARQCAAALLHAVLLGFGPLDPLGALALVLRRLRGQLQGLPVGTDLRPAAPPSLALVRRCDDRDPPGLSCQLGIKGEGLPWEIYVNIRDYSSGFQAAGPLDLWYPITYLPLAFAGGRQWLPRDQPCSARSSAKRCGSLFPLLIRTSPGDHRHRCNGGFPDAARGSDAPAGLSCHRHCFGRVRSWRLHADVPDPVRLFRKMAGLRGEAAILHRLHSCRHALRHLSSPSYPSGCHQWLPRHPRGDRAAMASAHAPAAARTGPAAVLARWRSIRWSACGSATRPWADGQPAGLHPFGRGPVSARLIEI